MNPVDLKHVLLAKHAQHVVLIHFPIALLIASFALYLLACWRRDRNLATVAYCILTAATNRAETALPLIGTFLSGPAFSRPVVNASFRRILPKTGLRRYGVRRRL